MEGTWAENRFADFCLWSDGAGASTHKRASLDHRLESEPNVKSVIINLLRTLMALLEKCHRTGKFQKSIRTYDGTNDQLQLRTWGTYALSTTQTSNVHFLKILTKAL